MHAPRQGRPIRPSAALRREPLFRWLLRLTAVYVLVFLLALVCLHQDRIIQGDRFNGWGILCALSAVLVAWLWMFIGKPREGRAEALILDDVRAAWRGARARTLGVVLLIMAPPFVVLLTFVSPAVATVTHHCEVAGKHVSHGAGGKADRYLLIVACADPAMPQRMRISEPPLRNWAGFRVGGAIDVAVERKLTGLRLWKDIVPVQEPPSA